MHLRGVRVCERHFIRDQNATGLIQHCGEKKKGKTSTYCDWLVLVNSPCYSEAQTNAYVLMQDHHLDIIIVLENRNIQRKNVS